MSSGRSGNLVKAFYLTREGDEPRVIDTNSIIEEKLGDLLYGDPEPAYVPSENAGEDYDAEPVFEGGLDAETLSALVGDVPEDAEYTGEYDEEGNPVSNVIKAVPRNEQESDGAGTYEEPMQGPSAEEIAAQAEAQIEAMKAEAAQEIEGLKAAGYEEGKTAGYNEGKAQAMAEINAERTALEKEKAGLEKQFEDMVMELEPRFVHTLTSIYEKIFEVDLSGHRELIVGLLRNAMTHVEGSASYMIHVSRDDYREVADRKDELRTGAVPPDAVIDIIEDATLNANECMIETPGGIFDCSLGTELMNLRKKLELLSYKPE